MSRSSQDMDLPTNLVFASAVITLDLMEGSRSGMC